MLWVGRAEEEGVGGRGGRRSRLMDLLESLIWEVGGLWMEGGMGGRSWEIG